MKKLIILSVLCTCLLNFGFAQISISDLEFVDSAEESRDPNVKIHKVRKGQTLFGIAQHYNIEVEKIKALNGMKSNLILPNQDLKIPIPEIEATPTDRGGLEPESAIVVGEDVPEDEMVAKRIMVEKDVLYIAREHDNINQIADNHEVSVQEILNWNGKQEFTEGERVIVGKKFEEIVILNEAKDEDDRSLAVLGPSRGDEEEDTKPNTVEENSLSSLGGGKDEPIVEEPKDRDLSGGKDEPIAFNEDTPPTPASIQLDLSMAVSDALALNKRDNKLDSFALPFAEDWNAAKVEASGYTELEDPTVSHTRFYAYHKTIQAGKKIRLSIPNNTGFIEAEVVGKLPPDANASLALSPACIKIIESAGARGRVGLAYE